MIIPVPTNNEPETIPEAPDEDWIRWFLNCAKWHCPKCNLTNFGRNKFCAWQECREPRPDWYKENTWKEQ